MRLYQSIDSYTKWKSFSRGYLQLHFLEWKILFSQLSIKKKTALVWIMVRRQTHYNDVIMGAVASQITSLTIVYSIVYSGADQRKHQSSASLAFVWGIHRGPVNSPHKWPVTRKMSPFDDVIMRPQAVIWIIFFSIQNILLPFKTQDSGLRTQDSGRIYSTWIYTVLLFIRYTQVCQYRINTILPDTKLICMLGDFY